MTEEECKKLIEAGVQRRQIIEKQFQVLKRDASIGLDQTEVRKTIYKKTDPPKPQKYRSIDDEGDYGDSC